MVFLCTWQGPEAQRGARFFNNSSARSSEDFLVPCSSSLDRGFRSKQPYATHPKILEKNYIEKSTLKYHQEIMDFGWINLKKAKPCWGPIRIIFWSGFLQSCLWPACVQKQPPTGKEILILPTLKLSFSCFWGFWEIRDQRAKLTSKAQA